MAAWPVDPRDPAQRVDKAMLFLIYNIMMLSSDGVDLTDKPQVRKLQARCSERCRNLRLTAGKLSKFVYIHNYQMLFI
jgi:hypothetical protein